MEVAWIKSQNTENKSIFYVNKKKFFVAILKYAN